MCTTGKRTQKGKTLIYIPKEKRKYRKENKKPPVNISDFLVRTKKKHIIHIYRLGCHSKPKCCDRGHNFFCNYRCFTKKSHPFPAQNNV